MHFDLLRKLRFIDYLIICVVILGGFILFKFFNPEERWVDASIAVSNIPFFQVNAIHINDIEKDPSGEKIAEVLGIKVFDTPQSRVANKDVSLEVKLLVNINSKTGEFEFKNKIIKVGSPIEFRFNNGYIKGVVATLGETKQKEETKILTIKLYNQWPWLADGIAIGESELGENGQKLVEVLSKDIKSAEITVTTSSGQTLIQTDPRKVDITLKIKVQVQKFNNDLLFRQDERVVVGENFSFNAGDTRIKDALIEKIE